MKAVKEKIKNSEFLRRLFDFSFKKFVTTKVVKFIFWINIVIAAVIAILTIVGGFQESIVLGIIALILAPIFYIIYIAILRVVLEVVVVIFRIGEYTEEITETITSTKVIEHYEVEVEDK